MGRYKDLTYRTEPCWKGYGVDIAIHLYKKKIVVYMPTREHPWRVGRLTGALPARDTFRVTWSNGRYSNLRGLWRIHDAKLFTGGRLPQPVKPASIQRTHQTKPRRVTMATKAKSKKARSTNGGVNIGELSAAEKKRLAQTVIRMRKAGTSWDEIKEETGLSSALQGRNLMRDYGGEALIREQEGGGSTPKRASTKRASTKATGTGAKRGKAKITVKRGKGKATNPS